MGFFSWKCRGCGHPLLSIYAINDINGWMLQAVVMYPDGDRVVGVYDGYGRIEPSDGNDLDLCVVDDHERQQLQVFPHDIDWEDGRPDCWHLACWEKAGRPEYIGESDSAADQGYFFEDEHDIPEPERAHGRHVAS